MKYLVALFAWLMPVVAWLSNTGVFGPTNGAISDQYPTLIVAAGYAFAIWGLIFLLDVVYGTWQLTRQAEDTLNRAVRPFTALAFALSSLWMIVFSLQWFWLALAVIWVSLVCIWYAAWRFSTSTQTMRTRCWGWMGLSLHAGWVSLAAFLNIAQVIVAYHLFSSTQMLPWTMVLFALVATLLLVSLAKMRGNPCYALAAAWGLIAVYVKQSASELHGAHIAAWAALALTVIVVVTSATLIGRQRRV
ncbi:MAG: hypothetical protein L0H70_06295 [Xanthomonadales bacterium]|nr:hypothetical protein [Xanthomonadales bacterium]